MGNPLEEAKAREAIVNSIRDLYTAKIILPLGNPNLKLVHTNQFLFLELENDIFDLENFDVIASALNSTYNRFGGYVKNRWYIEKVNIKNDGSSGQMELTVNPFPSSLLNYRDTRNEFMDKFNEAMEKKKNNSNTSTTTVASVKTKNTTVTGGEDKVIDDLVKKIIGKETDPLKKAKLIHEWLRVNLGYSRYSGTKYNTVILCYNHRKHLNCADTSRLTRAMMSSAGLTAEVVHGPNHFWTRMYINGKWYASDATSRYRKFNQVWKNLKFYERCGKVPSA